MASLATSLKTYLNGYTNKKGGPKEQRRFVNDGFIHIGKAFANAQAQAFTTHNGQRADAGTNVDVHRDVQFPIARHNCFSVIYLNSRKI